MTPSRSILLTTAALLVSSTGLATARAADSAAASAEPAPPPSAGVELEMLAHPSEPGRRVELYWAAPAGDERLPALLYVHGHQFGDRPGARFYVDQGVLVADAARGLVAAAVSQPGYGESGGPPDFCGPASQQAVHAAIAFLRRHPRVDPGRIALFGASRGAIVASVVAIEDPELAAVVLRGGAYDTADSYARLDPDDPIGAGIRANVEKESGATPEAFRRRSALLTDEVSRVPTLFLHGEDDDRSPVDQVRALAARLAAAGTPVEVRVYRGAGHRVPVEWRRGHVERFLERHLFASPTADRPAVSARNR